MPSAFSHAAAALALGTAFRSFGPPVRFWALGAACATLPDLDVLAFRFGIPYHHPLGHRGVTHSFAFAAALAAVLTWAAFRVVPEAGGRMRVWLFLALATASHGMLDAMTNGGEGVALLAPFDNARYFLPWQPIEVSPIGVRRFFSRRGAEVMWSELRWVWLPACALAATCLASRRARRRA